MRSPLLLTGLMLSVLLQFAHASHPLLKPNHGFTENKGQIRDQFENRRDDVSFLVNLNAYKVGFHSLGWSYEKHVFESDTGRSKVFINRVDFKLLNGINEEIQYSGQHPSSYYKNFYGPQTGNKGVTRVRDYEFITTSEIYKGIHASFSVKEERLKYEFSVSPIGLWADIAIEISGGENLSIDSEGNLIIATPLGKFTEHAPVAYFEDADGKMVEVEVAYRLQGNILSFQVGDYPRDRTLVIDPFVEWGTYYGGTRSDWVESMDTDSDNNIIIGGQAHSRDLYITSGAFQTEHSQYNRDGFMAKFDPDGQLLWSTYMGDVDDERVSSIVTDSNNDVYFAGYTTNDIGLTTPGTFLPNGSGGPIVAKFGSDGTLIWGTYADAGGSAWDVSLDYEGNLLVVGNSSSVGPLATPGTHQTTNAGSTDGFLIRLTAADGQKIWGTYYGGPESDHPRDVVGDSQGNIYVSGWGRSNSGIATPGALIESYDPWIIDGAFHLVKFNSSGQRLWGTYYGCRHDGRADGLAIYQDSIIYLYGGSSCNTDIATPGTYLSVDPGSYARSVARFNQHGELIWGTYIINDGNNVGDEIDVDSQGNLIISGMVGSGNTPKPTTPDAVQLASGGDPQFTYNGYVIIFNPNGQKVFGTYLGNDDGSGTELVVFDKDENIVAAGSSYGTNTIATPGAWQTENADPGESDAIVIKIDRQCTESFTFNISGPTAVCPGAKDLMFTTDTMLNTVYWELPYGSRITEHNGDTVIFDLGIVSGWVVAHQQSGCRYAPVDSVYLSVTTDYPSVNIQPESSFCDGDEILFYTSNPHQSNLSWTFADQTSYATDSVAKVASSALNGYVYLSAEHDGCYQYDSIPFAILASPTLTVIGDTVACVGEQIALNAQGTFNVIAWNGVVGNNNYSIQLSEDTVINVLVSITGGCSMEVDRPLTAIDVPIPFITGANTLCNGDTTVLYASGIGDYEWSNGSLNDSIVVHPSASAQYGLEVNNGYCSAETNLLVTVNQLPTVSIQGNAGFCAGDSAALQASGAVSFLWNTGATSAQIVTSNPGSFSVVGQNSNGCSSTSAIFTLVEYPLPPNGLTVSGPTTFCSGGNVQISAPTGYQYDWVNSTSTSSAITVNTSNNYSVAITSANNCVSYSDTIEVTVRPRPNANIGHTGLTFCLGDSIMLTVSPTTGVSYLWTNGATSQSISVSQSGSYGVTVTNSYGCQDTEAPVQANAIPLPTVGVTPIGTATVCEGQQITLTATSASPIQWSNGLTDIDITVNASGVYSASATNSQGCIGYSDTFEVVVLPLPSANISFPNDTIFRSDSIILLQEYGMPNGGQFFVDGNVGAQLNLNQLQEGEHHLMYIYSDMEGCTDTASFTLVVLDGCTQNPEEVIATVEISPNPTASQLQLKFQDNVCQVNGITASIYTATGALIAQTKIASQIEGWDISFLNAGIYFIELRVGDTAVMKRFVKL